MVSVEVLFIVFVFIIRLFYFKCPRSTTSCDQPREPVSAGFIICHCCGINILWPLVSGSHTIGYIGNRAIRPGRQGKYNAIDGIFIKCKSDRRGRWIAGGGAGRIPDPEIESQIGGLAGQKPFVKRGGYIGRAAHTYVHIDGSVGKRMWQEVENARR